MNGQRQPARSGASVDIVAVSKHFTPGGRGAPPIHVIDDVSMHLGAGEFVVYLGPSGCGKTTLMRIIGGLETASAGQVRLHGEAVSGPDRRRGMVFQAYTSFPWLSVLDNVRFGTRYRPGLSAAEKEAIADRYLALVGLDDYRDFFVNRISGGMRQRVAIARTLAAGPQVLLMDEPFGALDAITRDFLQEQLRDICRNEGLTVVFVTHDVDEAVYLADRVMMFSARPARVIREIDVSTRLGSARPASLKESDAFFHLRNEVRDVMRAEAQA